MQPRMLRSLLTAPRFSIQSVTRTQTHGRPFSFQKALYSATDAPATPSSSPTQLSRLRDDLKSAMRARDTTRLNVLRAILADITNLSKTSNPVNDDLALLALLKKRMSTVRQSIQEFYEADRKELVAKEEEQLKVLEDYAGNIKVLTQHEVRSVVEALVDEIQSNGNKASLSEVMKRCNGQSSAFEGQMVEKSTIVAVVKEVLATKNSST